MQRLHIQLSDAHTGGWRRFLDVDHVLEARSAEAVPPLLARLDAAVAERRWAIAGFLSYEAAAGVDSAMAVLPSESQLPLAWFACCRRSAPADAPAARRHAADIDWRPELEAADHAERIGHAREWVAAGETYQLNLTYRLRGRPCLSPMSLLEHLLCGQGGRYGGLVDTPEWAVVSASPELLLERQGQTVRSRPMKGTWPRGPDAQQDTRYRDELAGSAKNRAENLMITDMIRNDLGRVATPGSVRVPELFAVEPYPAMWQMTSEVSAHSHAGVGALLTALFPGASITGAPKVRSTQLIRRLERSPRGIYSGSLGFVLPDGRMQFNVAIRTAEIDHRSGRASYGVGGGIVWDSDPAEEWRESLLKARPLPGRVITEGTQSRRQPRHLSSVVRAESSTPSLLETLAWTPDEGYRSRTAHLERITASARVLGHAVSRHGIEASLTAASRDWHTPRRVRLTVSPSGEIEVQDQPLTALPAPWRIRLTAEPASRAGAGPFHKTTARADYDRWLAWARPAHDALLWNEHGELTESCIANLVLEFDGTRLTPPLRCGLLPGLERAALLAAGAIEEAVLTLEDLQAADRVWLCNSVRGLWPAVLESPIRSERPHP